MTHLSHHQVDENEGKKSEVDANQRIKSHLHVQEKLVFNGFVSGLQVNETDWNGKTDIQVGFIPLIGVGGELESDNKTA